MQPTIQSTYLLTGSDVIAAGFQAAAVPQRFIVATAGRLAQTQPQ
jgi:hypothetical protein